MGRFSDWRDFERFWRDFNGGRGLLGDRWVLMDGERYWRALMMNEGLSQRVESVYKGIGKVAVAHN